MVLLTGFDSPDEELEFVQNNYLKIDIYFKTLNVQTIVQQAKYNAEGYFAALGGALSFYIGVAIIMAFEIIEFFYDLFMNIWLFHNGPRK